MKAKEKEKKHKQSRWGGRRQGAGRHEKWEKSRFTHVTRIDPSHTKVILKEKGLSFAEKLDSLIQKAIDLCKK